MAASRDNPIDQLARRLREAGTIEALRSLIRDIAALEGTAEETEGIDDLRDESFEGLRRMTVDRPGEARDVLIEDLLPLCLLPRDARPGKRRRRHYGEFLRDWLDAYPSEERRRLRDELLAPVKVALGGVDPESALATASYLGYRDAGLLAALHALVVRRDDELGDRALQVIIALGVPRPDQKTALAELHRRMAARWDHTLVACLRNLPDRSSLDLVLIWLRSRSEGPERHEEPLIEDMTLQVLPAIADRHAEDDMLQDSIWQRIADLRSGDDGPVDRALRMNGQLAGGVDTPDVVPAYLELIDGGATKTHDIAYYRLEDLVRPRQLLGWGHDPDDQVLAVMRRDARIGSSMEGRWASGELRLKLLAWDTLLSLGRRDALELLGPAVASETNGFALGELFEIAACTEVGPLPPDVPGLIAAHCVRVPDEENQRLIAQIGAIGVAHAARSREAFGALLGYETISSGGVLISLIDALADCAAACIAAGDSDAERILWLAIGRGEPATRRTAAASALARLIRRRIVHPSDAGDLLVAIGDETLEVYARRELIDAAGYLDATPPNPRIVSALKSIALGTGRPERPEPKEGARPALAQVALGALARLGILATDPNLLEDLLGLVRIESGWGLTTGSDRSREASFVVGILYATDPKAFAPAVAGLIDTGDWGTMSRLRPHLTLGPIPAPPAVVEALVQRIWRVQTGRTAEPELFALLAHLAPDRLVHERWSGWENCPPQVRAAFADAIGAARPPEHALLRLLLPLMGDGQYGVRRAAYRAAAVHAPILATICRSWATTTSGRDAVELRERAAEAAGWLSLAAKTSDVEALAVDTEPTVRQAYTRCDLERRERDWATLYVDQVVKVESGDEVLGEWRYGRALGHVGDDLAIERLEQRRSDPNLSPVVRRWLSRVIKLVRKRWDETTRSWPEPWFARRGRLEEVAGVYAGSDGFELPFQGWLWQVVPGDPTGFSSWGGWALGTSPWADPTILKIEGRTSAKITVSTIDYSNNITYFFGNGIYPVLSCSQ